LIISGDADLTQIRHHKGIEIMSPAQFLTRMQSQTAPEEDAAR